MINNVLLGWVLALSSVVIWPVLLPLSYIIACLPCLALLKRWPLLVGIGLGAIYGQLACHYISGQLQPLPIGEVTVVARLSSASSGAALYQRSQWLVESVSEQPLAWYQNQRIELGWYQPPQLKEGQRYRLNIKLRPPSGYLNAGGFNRYRHQLSKGIGAVGYVKSGEMIRDADTWRNRLRTQLKLATEPLQHGAVLRALVLADKSDISQALWQKMRQAGLIHLLAISGLHLSIIAGGTLLIATWLRKRLFANPYGRGQGVVWLFTAGVAIGYGVLAQLGLPTMRATMAVLVGLLLLWQKRQGRPWEILLRVAAVIVLVEPLASMSAGYWLSFGAVSLILLSLWFWPHSNSKWLVLVKTQCVLTVGMVLLQGVWFGEYSLHGIWTNLLLLPYFSVVVLPICIVLSVAVWLGATAEILVLADWVLAPIMYVASWASGISIGYGTVKPESLLLIAVFAVVLMLLRWRKVVGAVVLSVSFLLWSNSAKPYWQLDLIDVGQGLAVLIQYQGEAMLVDTGASYPSGFSYVQTAIAPVLRHYGIERLKWLVVSHGDNDHAGGVEALKQLLSVHRHIGFGGENCNAGPKQWGELQLRWYQAPLKGNDGSCVLMISSRDFRVLLPGDIESKGELAWLNQAIAPKVDLLIAPHHGSLTSSSLQFVESTKPQWVLFAAGNNNRWGFPADQVRKRYLEVGSNLLVSGEVGQIRFTISLEGQVESQNYRQNWAPWWYNQQ